MNLPPEIKSAEEHVTQCRYATHIYEAFELQNQCDIAIWNAAIEKAAETADIMSIEGYSTNYKQAILNLKQKK